jgi:hypothetical protein
MVASEGSYSLPASSLQLDAEASIDCGIPHLNIEIWGTQIR